jgi:hypothetical protein
MEQSVGEENISRGYYLAMSFDYCSRKAQFQCLENEDPESFRVTFANYHVAEAFGFNHLQFSIMLNQYDTYTVHDIQLGNPNSSNIIWHPISQMIWLRLLDVSIWDVQIHWLERNCRI